MWSTLAEKKTWFGKQQMYESYGIQLIPLTSIVDLRDELEWIDEMLPTYNESCFQHQGFINIIC